MTMASRPRDIAHDLCLVTGILSNTGFKDLRGYNEMGNGFNRPKLGA